MYLGRFLQIIGAVAWMVEPLLSSDQMAQVRAPQDSAYSADASLLGLQSELITR